MKISLLAISDYAWLGYTFSQCLQRVGVDATMFVYDGKDTRKRSAIRKGCGVIFSNIDQIKNELIKSDIIQFMQGQFLNTGIDLSKKRVFVFYGGSNYRENHKKINKIFNPIVEKSIIQTGDLFGLGAKNEVWLLPAVDTENIKPVFMKPDKTKKIIIGHFPSNPKTKGSKQINGVMEKLKEKYGNKFEYNYSGKRVRWNDQIKRVSECDIYINACKSTMSGRRIGSVSVSMVEAAALGKIVINNFIIDEEYKKEFGKHSIVISNSTQQLEDHIERLLNLSSKELLEIQMDTREWVEKLHSYESIGMRMKEKIYEI